MTIRFAAPIPPRAAHFKRFVGRGTDTRPANDNDGLPSNAMLHAALRYFAEHGIAAAQCARREAEAAFLASDREGYRWWLEVCRTLDRRTAAAMETRSAAQTRAAELRPAPH